MSSITIHALDSELDQRLTEEARSRKKSKNQLVKELLARSLGMRVDGRYADDYREFCGLWSAGELAAFNTTQTENSRVDAMDWQS
jgi:ABC-type phosphate/phosphonate transport system substrate-binding protein